MSAGRTNAVQGSTADFKAECIKWIKEKGNKYTLSNFGRAFASADVETYQGLYFFYRESVSGEELDWIPWVYGTASNPYAMNGGANYIFADEIGLYIEPDASYSIQLENTSIDPPAPTIIYVFPGVELYIE